MLLTPCQRMHCISREGTGAHLGAGLLTSCAALGAGVSPALALALALTQMGSPVMGVAWCFIP